MEEKNIVIVMGRLESAHKNQIKRYKKKNDMLGKALEGVLGVMNEPFEAGREEAITKAKEALEFNENPWVD